MILWNPLRIAKYLHPGLICNVSTNKQTVYLTFDDGPTVDISTKVLEILKRYNALATFFCSGRNAERNQDILSNIVHEGHAVGNHTYSHLKGWYTSNHVYYADIEMASRFIPSALFRPPYGLIKPSQIKYLRQYYKIIMWSLLSYDYHPHITKEQCLKYVMKNTKPGSIIVFHDSAKASQNMLYALPRILDNFSERGYTFESLVINQ